MKTYFQQLLHTHRASDPIENTHMLQIEKMIVDRSDYCYYLFYIVPMTDDIQIQFLRKWKLFSGFSSTKRVRFYPFTSELKNDDKKNETDSDSLER